MTYHAVFFHSQSAEGLEMRLKLQVIQESEQRDLFK